MQKKELLIYLDPGFLNDLGHYHNIADSIHKEASRRNVIIRHCVNKEVCKEAAEKYRLERVFSFKPFLRQPHNSNTITGILRNTAHSAIAEARNRALLLRTFLQEKKTTSQNLRTLTRNMIWNQNRRVLYSFAEEFQLVLDTIQSDIYKKITLYMYTAAPSFLPCIAQAVKQKQLSSNIQAYVSLFYLNRQFCEGKNVVRYKRKLKTVSQTLRHEDPERRVHIVADSHRTIVKYSPFFRRDISLFPIPLDQEGIDSKPCRTSIESKDKIVIGFFGLCNFKQGYHLIMQLYDHIVQTPAFDRAQFIVRHNTGLSSSSQKKLAQDFRTRTKRITHLEGNLQNEEYSKRLSGCDIILIPHSADYYPCQTSGLFVDALKKCKVVVVPDNTWMADMLREFGSGETFVSGDLTDFIRAVEAIYHNLDKYLTRTDRNIDEFLRFHTAKTLFDKMQVGCEDY